MKVINMFAGPSSGKSTTAAGVFSLLKLHNVNAELVTEFAKDLTWEDRETTLANQHYVWAKQYHRIWRLKDQVDVVITDAPLVNSLVYGGCPSVHFSGVILESFNTFDNSSYFLNRIKPYNTAGRLQSEDKAKLLDQQIKNTLYTNDILFRELDGDYSAINAITKDFLGNKLTIDMNRIN